MSTYSDTEITFNNYIFQYYSDPYPVKINLAHLYIF